MRYDMALKEAFFDAFSFRPSWGGKTYIEIYKNPTSKEYKGALKPGSARGVLTIDGYLYIFSGEILHDDVLAALSGQDVPRIDDPADWYTNAKYLDDFMCIISHGNKEINIAESYSQNVVRKIITEYFDEYNYNLQNKNPGFKLI